MPLLLSLRGDCQKERLQELVVVKQPDNVTGLVETEAHATSLSKSEFIAIGMVWGMYGATARRRRLGYIYIYIYTFIYLYALEKGPPPRGTSCDQICVSDSYTAYRHSLPESYYTGRSPHFILLESQF